MEGAKALILVQEEQQVLHREELQIQTELRAEQEELLELQVAVRGLQVALFMEEVE